MNSLFLETATSRLDSTYERDHHSSNIYTYIYIYIYYSNESNYSN